MVPRWGADRWSVELTNGFPCTGMSASVFVMASGLAEFDTGKLMLFPNPMTEYAQVKLEGFTGDILLELFDLEGRLIRRENHQQAGQLMIKRDGLSSGEYVIRLSSADKVLQSTLIVR